MGAHDARIDRLRVQMAEHGVDAVVVSPGSDLRYLSGYDALPLERPTLLVVRHEGPVRLLAPHLEEVRAAQEVQLESVEIVSYGEHDDALGVAGALIADAPPARGRIAVGDQMWASFLLGLQHAVPDRRWSTASEVIAPLRSIKDEDELALLAAVGRAIDDVHRAVPDVLRPGRRERDVARDLASMIREQHDDVSFVIVASGPNAASPHHEPGDRTVVDGDVVVVDIGGTLDGYCSDMTRTYAVGSVPDGFADAYEVLRAAQSAAVAAVRPGVTAGSIDAAARQVLVDAGLGDAFIHRTGHGIGLDTHEPPWILGGNELVLEEGMTFSVEPGFYLEGRFGARIEDIVAVSADGSVSYNVVDRDLVVIG
jgi:Xaa-Pro aminopeptidase